MKTLFRSLLVAIIAGPLCVQPLCAMHSDKLTIPSSSYKEDTSWEVPFFNAYTTLFHDLKSAEEKKLVAACVEKTNNSDTQSEEKPQFLLLETLKSAVDNNKVTLVDKLLEVAKQTKIPQEITTQFPLDIAIRKDNATIVRSFVTHGLIDPQSLVPGSTDTPLRYATQHKASQVLEILVPLYPQENLDEEICSLLPRNGKERQESMCSQNEPVSLISQDNALSNQEKNTSDTYTVYVNGKVVATGSTIPATVEGQSHPLPQGRSWINWGIGTAAVGTAAGILARYIIKK